MVNPETEEREHPELTQRVADNIRYYRKLRRMNQRELSAAIMAAESYISTIENVPRMPSFLMAMRICRQLGIEPEALLKSVVESSS